MKCDDPGKARAYTVGGLAEIAALVVLLSAGHQQTPVTVHPDLPSPEGQVYPSPRGWSVALTWQRNLIPAVEG